MSNAINQWNNNLMEERGKDALSNIMEYLTNKNIQCKCIVGTTHQTVRHYNKYFIDNDDWAIMFQVVTCNRNNKDIQTLLISRANKPFSFRINHTLIAWDGYKIAKSKIGQIESMHRQLTSK